MKVNNKPYSTINKEILKEMEEMNEEKTETLNINLKRPDQIKDYLDQYVIGQDEAKKTLSVAVYNHYKRIINNNIRNNVEVDKSNIILMGETGCGKTLLVKTIAKMLNVPCYIQDTTKLTASGYVGSDVEDCIVGLLRTCRYNIPKAQVGIIVLDEGDKIAKKDAGPSITRDVSGECVQQSLLKIVEGDIVGVPPNGGRKRPDQELMYVDTSNILFILSGAFVGIDNIVKKRMGKNTIGFNLDNLNVEKNVENDEYFDYVSHQDIRDFGMIPEFAGRFPIITNVNKLSVDDMVRIIKEPKNSIMKQYTELMMMDGITLSFTDDALDYIARLSLQLKTGARGLRAIFECVMNDIMFDAPKNAKTNNNIEINKETVQEKTKKKYGYLELEEEKKKAA